MTRIVVGLVAAFIASLMFNFGLVLQKEGAAGLPGAHKLSLETVRLFLSNGRWMAGTSITIGGYGLEFMSFALAPFILVQPVFSAGVISLALFAVIIAGERLHVQEWVGLAVTISGAICVGVTADPQVDRVAHQLVHSGRLPLSLLAALLAAFVAYLAASKPTRASEVLYGLAAGFAFTGSEILTKLVGIHVIEGRSVLRMLFSPPVVALIIFGLVGTWMLQVGFQHGRALIVGAVMGIAADVLPMISGLMVFGEAMPSGGRFYLRLFGMIAAISGALVVTLSPSTEHLMEKLEHFQEGADDGGDVAMTGEADEAGEAGEALV